MDPSQHIPRPAPPDSTWQRVTRVTASIAERLHLRRSLGRVSRGEDPTAVIELDEPSQPNDPVRQRFGFLRKWHLVAIALGSAFIALAAAAGLQVWQQRHGVDIAQDLPQLVPASTPQRSELEPSSESGALGLQQTAGDRDGDSSSVDRVIEGQGSDEAAHLGDEADHLKSAGFEHEDARDSPSGLKDTDEDPITDHAALALIVVHVAGEVRTPGVVSIPAGSRVYQAVQAAGGALDSADVDRVNLAQLVVDGERIYVPAPGESVPILEVAQRPNDQSDRGEAPGSVFPIDINSASVDALQELPGVGPATAAAIVDTRHKRGPFRSVEELVDVAGIGPVKLGQLQAFATVR